MRLWHATVEMHGHPSTTHHSFYARNLRSALTVLGEELRSRSGKIVSIRIAVEVSP